MMDGSVLEIVDTRAYRGQYPIVEIAARLKF